TPEIKPEEPKQITATSSTYGVLTIETKTTTNSLSIRIKDVPDGARLECHLNQEPLTPCHDGAVYDLPREGRHKISAIAIKDDRIVALGESKAFEVAAVNSGNSSPEDKL